MVKKGKSNKPKKADAIAFVETKDIKPINLKDLGTKHDPCFGKIYDLSKPECKQCGDSELCAIAMSQNLNISRKELNDQNKYKDLETLLDVKGIKKYIRSLKRKGLEKKEIIKKTVEKFDVSKTDVRDIYKTVKDK